MPISLLPTRKLLKRVAICRLNKKLHVTNPRTKMVHTSRSEATSFDEASNSSTKSMKR